MDLEVFQYVSTYRVINKVAEGGMGQVYLAEQLGVSGFSKTVGIKTIRRELLDRYYYRDMFIDEAKLVASLIHENIQQVYQLVDMAGSLAIVMEWVHGITLEDINARLDDKNDYLPPELAVFVTSRIARALAYAHDKRGPDGRPLFLVHRDVSPVNIFVSWGGVVKLADFGIAKAMSARKSGRDGEIMGKAPYLAPEQARGQAVDARSDIFSLGLVLFELLTGEQVYPVEAIDDAVHLHETREIPSPREWNPSISPEIEVIMRKMLERDPNKRYQRAKHIVRDLELLLYSGGYGPTNERLAEYIDELFPEVDKHRLLPEEMILPR
ncbi:MAG: serine/threonine protein kinase [Myxococcales bacterium]|nr:serine/threonine protein kinase [Myxococcales bacterium]MCB9733797.1 serine/threonine protein kinase [Deltaproteobacteria bacterium]